MTGAARIPATTVNETANVRKVKVAERELRSFSRDSVSRYRRNVGMNATEMLFSANSRRKRFGMKNATVNASESCVVPRKAAFVISRRRPSIREPRVRSESREPLLRSE